MSGSQYGALVLGVLVWAAVAVLAVVIQVGVEDQVLGFFLVLAAVIAAWAAGEFIVRADDRGRQ
ncbi:MAG: hypothetical protein WD800_08145 [Dehalococcoidia bacterium]